MKKMLTALLASLTLIGATATSTAMAQTYPKRAIRAKERGERHPVIRRAINALGQAKDDLEDAAQDYCGHRVEALEASNNAIRELRLALAIDRASVQPLEVESAAGFIQLASYTSPASEWHDGRERHPRIIRAINALEGARDDLQNAAHDFHGHRAEALEAVNRALNQLQAAIACDRR
jgi:hypothetical protein